jgi:hypothetical protein
MDNSKEKLQQGCSASGIDFVNAEAEEAYKKRAGRVSDVVLLKTPEYFNKKDGK